MKLILDARISDASEPIGHKDIIFRKNTKKTDMPKKL